MRKALTILGLLGLLSQPVMAQQCLMGTPVIRPSNVTGGAACVQSSTTVCPIRVQAPIQSCCPTGGAATITPSVQVVKIPKKHWWNRSRKGYVPVCPTTTGGAAMLCPTSKCQTGMAAPICPTACPAPACPTGMAAPVCPTACPTGFAAGANVQPVLVPKKHFWEKDQVKLMPVSPTPTGAAAPIGTTLCPTMD